MTGRLDAVDGGLLGFRFRRPLDRSGSDVVTVVRPIVDPVVTDF
jgi:hypothetical protein